VPYSEALEAYVLPDEDKVVDAVRKTLETVSA
jgi:pyruvate/2-oxoglutarate/acetoin dehydrogenase E1 component